MALHIRFKLVHLFLIVAVVGVALWAGNEIVDLRERAFEPAREAQCRASLSQLGLALRSYQEWYGSFPPPFIANDKGVPMHSWRVLILPWIDQLALYNRYDFNEPWNGPNNAKLAVQMPLIYRCPNHSTGSEFATNYVAIIPADPSDASPLLPDRVLVAEITEIRGREVHWMEPVDLRLDDMSFVIADQQRPSISSSDSYGPVVVFANGDVKRLSQTMTPEMVRTILTGTETDVDEDRSNLGP